MKAPLLSIGLGVVIVVAVWFVYTQYFSYQSVSLENIESNPQSYNGERVKLTGVVVQFKGAFFGPTYWLFETDSFDIQDFRD